MPEGEVRERNIDSPSRLGVALSMVCEVDVGATVPPGVPPPHAPMMQTTFHPVECAGHAPGVSLSILFWVTVCARSDGAWNKPPRKTKNERKNRQGGRRKRGGGAQRNGRRGRVGPPLRIAPGLCRALFRSAGGRGRSRTRVWGEAASLQG